MAIQLVEVDTVKHEGSSLSREIASLVVIDQESFDLAAGYRQAIGAYLKRVDALCDPAIRAGDAAHKAALALKKTLQAPGLEGKKVLDGLLTTWEQEQRQLARLAQAAADREREKAEEEVRLQWALEAEAAGDGAKAQRILEAPHPPEIVFSPPAVVPAPTKTDGLQFSTHWSAKVVDLRAFVQAWLDGLAPPNSVVPNLVPLNELARKLKGELNIPGVLAVAARRVKESS